MTESSIQIDKQVEGLGRNVSLTVIVITNQSSVPCLGTESVMLRLGVKVDKLTPIVASSRS